MQRVQQSPKTYKAMQRILSRVQNQLMVNSRWIGSSVIHMGDHNVPNALSFTVLKNTHKFLEYSAPL